MTGETADLLDQPAHKRDPPVARVDADGAKRLVIGAGCLASPCLSRQRRLNIAAEAEYLGHLAKRAARAIGDHRRGQPGPGPPVSGIDMLDHLLAALMLEIDIDIGRLAARLADKTLEQGLRAVGIDRGDPKAVADRRIRRRAAPLAQDAAIAGKADNVEDGQEIGREFHLGDQRQLAFQICGHLVRHTIGVALARPVPCLILKLSHRVAPAGRDLVRIFIGQVVHGEIA